jgi:molecular chaperone DnaJ
MQAMLGDTVEVATLDEPVTLKIAAGTQGGSTLRVRGRGVPAGGKHPVGDLLVTVDVVIPKKLNKEQRTLVEKLSKSFNEEVTNV